MGTYVQLHAPLPGKTFILMTFRSPSDAATILKNPRIDAESEPEIVIKLIENYFFLKLLFKIKKITDALQL